MDLEMGLKLIVIVPIIICAAIGVFYAVCQGFILLYNVCQKLGQAVVETAEVIICIITKYFKRITKNRKSGRV